MKTKRGAGLLLAFLIGLFFISELYSFDDYEPVRFKIDGSNAIMTGTIDEHILSDLKKMLSEHPQVTTIVMQDVEGSVDDEANLLAARYVREKGLNTYLPADGMIASGGTDFFLAGVERVAEPSGKIGVHSWGADEGENITAVLLPRDHEEHQKYLEYYREMGTPTDFYWFTLRAASAENIHWMTEEEIKQYHITTR